jgi:hypothetical protein
MPTPTPKTPSWSESVMISLDFVINPTTCSFWARSCSTKTCPPPPPVLSNPITSTMTLSPSKTKTCCTWKTKSQMVAREPGAAIVNESRHSTINTNRSWPTKPLSDYKRISTMPCESLTTTTRDQNHALAWQSTPNDEHPWKSNLSALSTRL